MTFSELVGIEAEQARRELSRRGTAVVEELLTSPPWPGLPAGALRVIATRPAADGVILIVAHDGYRRTPRSEVG